MLRSWPWRGPWYSLLYLTNPVRHRCHRCATAIYITHAWHYWALSCLVYDYWLMTCCTCIRRLNSHQSLFPMALLANHRPHTSNGWHEANSNEPASYWSPEDQRTINPSKEGPSITWRLESTHLQSIVRYQVWFENRRVCPFLTQASNRSNKTHAMFLVYFEPSLLRKWSPCCASQSPATKLESTRVSKLLSSLGFHSHPLIIDFTLTKT
jgi:hypothetical protein